MRRHFYQYAVKQAKAYPYNIYMDFWVYAVIVSGGRVLSSGSNQHKKNAFVGAYYCEHSNKHAELNAIQQVRRKTDLRGAKIYVVRVQHDRKTLAMARPCEYCQELLRAYGIKRAYYSVADEEFGVLNLTGVSKADI